MWFLLASIAIVFAGLNLIWSFQNKDSKWFRFISLSLTALTVTSAYADGARRITNEDWSGLMDIMPTMSKVLWVCVILSIIINSISLFKENK
ncbi:MAG: hypothetical protein GX219_03105 [Tissierellia bacterium]|nr:hypothetical protein [Tissierellia bacterium]